MKKILFVIPTLTGGGAERVMSNITLNFKEDIQMDLLLNSISEDDYPTNAHKISLGMKVTREKSLQYQGYAFLKRYLKLKELKKTGNYDACISFLDSANIANILTKNNHRCKTIISVRDFIYANKTKAYKFIVCPLAKLLYNKADKVICVSNAIKINLNKKLGISNEKLLTVYNGIDLEKVKNLKEKSNDLKIKQDEIKFVTSGRLINKKAQSHLIRAFAKVVAEIHSGQLIILGDGKDRNYLEKLVKRLNITDRVLFVGYLENPYSIISKCDIFVLTSIFEGFPNVLVEALACGLPCISSDCLSGPREILAPNTSLTQITKKNEYAEYGILTPVCSGKYYEGIEDLELEEELLANAMIELYENQKLRENYKIKALMRAQQLSMEKCINQWIEVIYE